MSRTMLKINQIPDSHRVGEIQVLPLNLVLTFIFDAEGNLIGIAHENLKQVLYRDLLDGKKLIEKYYPDFQKRPDMLEGFGLFTWNKKDLFGKNFLK